MTTRWEMSFNDSPFVPAHESEKVRVALNNLEESLGSLDSVTVVVQDNPLVLRPVRPPTHPSLFARS